MSCRLEVRGLVMAFGAAFRLGPIDFEADRGVVYVEGQNGSGKTTRSPVPPSARLILENGGCRVDPAAEASR